MVELLFDPPFWVLGLLGVAAVALIAHGLRSLNKPRQIAGGALLLVGLIWGLLAYFVTTDLEMAVHRTRQIASAVDQRDWKSMSAAMDDLTSFENYNNRKQIVDGAAKTADAIGLRSVRTTSVQARQTGSLINVDVNCLSVQDATAGEPVPTSWRFSFAQTKGGLVLERIQILDNGTIHPDDVRSHLIH